MLLEVTGSGMVGMAQGRARRAEYDARQAEDERDAAIDEANGEIRKANALLANARQRIAQIEDELAVEKAHSAGLEAQSKAYRDQHPDSPLRVDIGRRYRDGAVKRRIHLIYEAAFDATLRKLMPRIDPTSRRAD